MKMIQIEPLEGIEILFQDKNTQTLIKKSILLERFSMIMLSQLLIKRKFSKLNEYFKELFKYLYRNFLQLMQLIILRVSKRSM